jgi:hypothetical protein
MSNKLNALNAGQVLGRSEMKKIMAGSGGCDPSNPNCVPEIDCTCNVYHNCPPSAINQILACCGVYECLHIVGGIKCDGLELKCQFHT